MEIEIVAVRTVGFTIHTRMIPNQEYNTQNMPFFLLFTNKTTKKMPMLNYAKASEMPFDDSLLLICV